MLSPSWSSLSRKLSDLFRHLPSRKNPPPRSTRNTDIVFANTALKKKKKETTVVPSFSPTMLYFFFLLLRAGTLFPLPLHSHPVSLTAAIVSAQQFLLELFPKAAQLSLYSVLCFTLLPLISVSCVAFSFVASKPLALGILIISYQTHYSGDHISEITQLCMFCILIEMTLYPRTHIYKYFQNTLPFFPKMKLPNFPPTFYSTRLGCHSEQFIRRYDK